MSEASKPLRFTPESMGQYRVLSDDLRFYADQRFKVMGAFILLNGFMGNLAKDFASVWLAGIGVLVSYLFLSWERRTTQWWGRLIEAVKVIEASGIEERVLVSGYWEYSKLRRSRILLKPSLGAQVLYVAFFATWVAFGINSWPHLWAKRDVSEEVDTRTVPGHGAPQDSLLEGANGGRRLKDG